jgi:phosphatidylserine/phosphatidylglycerophosphate/cardiolipin synthase-like enzyme
MADPPFTSDILPVIPLNDGIAPFLPILPIPRIAGLGSAPTGNEFRVDSLPLSVQKLFKGGNTFWLIALDVAIRQEKIKDTKQLADMIFFMHHPERIKKDGGFGLIDPKEEEFIRLRAEWDHYHTIASRWLDPSLVPDVFLPEQRSTNYEDYVAAQTTGRITLMVNGRKSGGFRGNGETEAFDSMQRTVESLGINDTIFLTAWQFIFIEADNGNPDVTPLTVANPKGLKTWIDLFKSKAKEGVKIRLIISDLPQSIGFMTDFKSLETNIGELPFSTQDNLKYIVSKHPANIGIDVGSHHQKFMVVKKSKTKIAYCGGLDISRSRIPGAAGWGDDFVWHDIHAKLEGLIVGDLEREFVLRWNREKDKSTAKPLPGWNGFEKLVYAPVDSVDKDRSKNTHKLQMLRTVSVGADRENISKDIKRDDVWQGYFRLIGSATRFIFMENQYFREPKMADAIVKQAQAQPGLIVIIVVSSGTDDPQTVDPDSKRLDRVKQEILFRYAQHCLALRHEFFTRFADLRKQKRLRVYTMPYKDGLVHSKLILVDDQFLSMGSANANPRDFFMDTQLNVMLDDAEAVTRFRHRLWSHDLGIPTKTIEGWTPQKFVDRWDTQANFNQDLLKKNTAKQTVGERIIPYDPLKWPGKKDSTMFPDVVC